MFKRIIFIVWFICIGCIAMAQAGKEEAAIRDAMRRQQAAWNNANLDSFMLYYWNSPELRFVSKKGIKKGWQEVYNGYKKNYQDGGQMGTLTFDIKSVDMLNKKQAMVVGSWKVENGKGVSEGYFTLWFKYIDGAWRIVLDHTS